MTKTAYKWLRSQGRTTDLAMLAAILIFFFVTFPHAIFGGRYLIVNDAFFYSYPLRTIAWRAIRSGELPLWTPSILSGYPLLSMAQLGLGYPLTWGYLFLSGPVAEQIYILAPFLLAPIFTYLFLRGVGRSAFASLLGALTFAYGGVMAGPNAHSGLLTNSGMWLPLVLLAIEHSQSKRLINAIALGTIAFSMSLMTGFGQGFTFVASISLAYALFLTFTTEDGPIQRRLAKVQQWRPLIVFIAVVIFSAGIAAFQILETARALRRSIRSQLSYEILTQGSLTPAELLQSIFKPLFFGVDTYAYVPPLALVLAVVASLAFIRSKVKRDPRVLFWIGVAIISLVLMLGAFTPLYKLIYYTPILNRFRVPARHAFEWTFAIGVLAAYGWDVAHRYFRARIGSHKFNTLFALALMCGALIVGVVWWRQMSELNGIATLSAGVGGYSLTVLKLSFFVISTLALWRAVLTSSARLRFNLTLLTLLGLVYIEPGALIGGWWARFNFSASRFSATSDATRFLQQFSPNENRVYTRVGLFSEQFDIQPSLDAHNLSAIFNLQNVAGYEPLIMQRYSRALGDVGMDSVFQISRYASDDSLLNAKSHVLDLLNTTYLVTYSNGKPYPNSDTLLKAEANIQSVGLLEPRTRKTFMPRVPSAEADALLLVSTLANSTDVPQSADVALIKVTLADGRVIEDTLRAGVDTAEWAHDRPDVKDAIKHGLATVFDEVPVAGPPSFPSYRFKKVIPFGALARVAKVEIENLADRAQIALHGANVMNTQTGMGTQLDEGLGFQWQPVYSQGEILILRNERVLSRAWLVANAKAVDGEEALRRIRGEGPDDFDPKETALLEVGADELPSLPGKLAPNSTSQIVRYQSNRIEVETNSTTASLLVLSEMFYPGWEAEVDGQPSRILLANFLLRAVSLPPGKHRVVMRYTAPAARNGAIISLLTLATLGVILFRSRRRQVTDRV